MGQRNGSRNGTGEETLEKLEATQDLCVDTDILVDFLRGRDPGSAAYNKWKDKANLLITSISVFELLMGAHLSSRRAQRIAEAESLIEQHMVLSLDKAAATTASQVASGLKTRGLGVEIRDLFNCSVCLTNKIPILTSNKTHYERIPDLSVISP